MPATLTQPSGNPWTRDRERDERWLAAFEQEAAGRGLPAQDPSADAEAERTRRQQSFTKASLAAEKAAALAGVRLTGGPPWGARPPARVPETSQR